MTKKKNKQKDNIIDIIGGIICGGLLLTGIGAVLYIIVGLLIGLWKLVF